jgi:radical SAM protein with 4Fe4S-binding SPASM domain
MHADTLKFYKYIPVKKPAYQDRFCWLPFTTVQIDNDGDVQLCDCQLHMPYTIGNIFKNSLQDIWLNHQANLVRQSVIDGDFTYCNWDCSKLSVLPGKPAMLPPERSFPKIIKLDLDLSCNLKCASCRETVIIEKNSQKIQKQIELYQEIKQQGLDYPNTMIEVVPLGSGEIFASHSAIKFLESLVDYPYQNLKINLTTNGTLITKNQDLIRSIQHLIGTWSISIDAATAETYSEVRGADWSTLMRGLDFIHSMHRPMKLNFVVQKANYHEISAFADLAHRYGAIVYYSNLLDWGHWTIQWWKDNNVMTRGSESYHAVLDSLRLVKDLYQDQIRLSADLANNLKKTEHN